MKNYWIFYRINNIHIGQYIEINIHTLNYITSQTPCFYITSHVYLALDHENIQFISFSFCWCILFYWFFFLPYDIIGYIIFLNMHIFCALTLWYVPKYGKQWNKCFNSFYYSFLLVGLRKYDSSLFVLNLYRVYIWCMYVDILRFTTLTYTGWS